MNDTMDSTETMTAPAVAARPQPTARTVSHQNDRPLRHAPRPPSAPRPPRRDDHEEDEGFFQRFRVPLIIGALVLGGVAYAVFGKSAEKKAPVKAKPQQIVKIQPLPPPPPPPKVQPPPPKQEDKKVEQAPMEKPDPKPEPAKPKPVDEPPALGTGLQGNGPGMAGLGARGHGGGTGLGGGHAGDLFHWYASQSVRPVTDALRTHPRTKAANMNVVANIWVDGSARIERARLVGSTGDAAMDTAIQNEVLPGVRLSEPPPAGMKMPIKLRLSARRPR